MYNKSLDENWSNAVNPNVCDAPFEPMAVVAQETLAAARTVQMLAEDINGRLYGEKDEECQASVNPSNIYETLMATRRILRVTSDILDRIRSKTEG